MNDSGMTTLRRTTEYFVPATIHRVRTIEPHEIRLVAFQLAEAYDIDGHRYSVRDAMRPGNAFLAKPLGLRTGKIRRRMYTRSNTVVTEPRLLETIINDTHEERADTSPWWQTEQIDAWHRTGATVDIRMQLDEDRGELVIFENSAAVDPKNLRLEPDDEWPDMRLVAIGLSTGITPFLAYARYMAASAFGRTAQRSGAQLLLIASVRTTQQLMLHDELLALERAFPENFRYYPVLTRAWPSDWPYGRGRLVRRVEGCEGQVAVELSALLKLIPDLGDWHLRMCGNAVCRHELEVGLEQAGIRVRSFRSEIW